MSWDNFKSFMTQVWRLTLSIDNTADVDKPVSTAQQTALDLKPDSSSLGTASAQNVDAFDAAGAASSAQTAAIAAAASAAATAIASAIANRLVVVGSGTGSLAFGSVLTGGNASQDIAVSGALVGDTVLPINVQPLLAGGTSVSMVVFQAPYVSSNGTVTLKASNLLPITTAILTTATIKAIVVREPS